MFLLFPLVDHFRVALYSIVLAIGFLVGLEIPLLIRILRGYGQALQQQGKSKQALPVAQSAWERMREHWGADHPRTSNAEEVLANIYQQSGDMQHALSLYQNIAQTRQRVLGPDHPHSLAILSSVASTLALLGRAAEGLEGRVV